MALFKKTSKNKDVAKNTNLSYTANVYYHLLGVLQIVIIFLLIVCVIMLGALITVKIVKPDTDEEVEYGTEGEICISGPTVMLGYLKHPDETAKTLRTHSDGRKWIHTGDLGIMDSEGFIYFKQRIKRMIITNGYNVYPSALENILDAHEFVQMSCVIGIPDPYKMQKVKAFIMLKPGLEPNEEKKQVILEYCKKNIAKYALPYDIEFRDALPKTLVGKVAYRELEQAELEKIKKQQESQNQ